MKAGNSMQEMGNQNGRDTNSEAGTSQMSNGKEMAIERWSLEEKPEQLTDDQRG
jgi:hypothetical protein